MEKIIHYCWFGGKPLPKVAHNCIASWKKFLPDFKIVEWNESNFDINATTFSKSAYENKKWAFVSDYVRMKVLYEQGGLYLDTDMEITKDISSFLENDIFLGSEDNGYVAAGIIWVKEKHNHYIKEFLDIYESNIAIDFDNLFDIAIPKIVTRVLLNYPKQVVDGIEIYDGHVYIYPWEYFYPLNYNYSSKNFTQNTCAIHYYYADWISKRERVTLFLRRKLGMRTANAIIGIFKVIKFPFRIFKKIFKFLLQKYRNIQYKFKLVYTVFFKRSERIRKLKQDVKNVKEDYISISHPNWLGVTNSTKTLFASWIGIGDTYFKKEPYEIATILANSGKRLIIFSGFAKGFEKIIENLHLINPAICIKVVWHGSNALLVEDTDYQAFTNVLNLYQQNMIQEIGFLKKSLYEFFKAKKYNVSFLTNVFTLDSSKYKKEILPRKHINIGIYSSLDRWIKNSYNQICAIALFENAKINIIPMSEKVKKFINILGIEINTSASGSVSHDELLKNILLNDVVSYVTFTECSPMIPLECLELGVPCITGDNHHYFEGTELEKYLVVSKEDNIAAIYEKMKDAIENKDKIISLYQDFRGDYQKEALTLRDRFLT